MCVGEWVDGFIWQFGRVEIDEDDIDMDRGGYMCHGYHNTIGYTVLGWLTITIHFAMVFEASGNSCECIIYF